MMCLPSRLDEPVSPDGLSDCIDLHALAESVAERLRPLAEKHEVSLRVEGQDGQRVLIDGNEPLMEQVMTTITPFRLQSARKRVLFIHWLYSTNGHLL